jgi:hypothetical protein
MFYNKNTIMKKFHLFFVLVLFQFIQIANGQDNHYSTQSKASVKIDQFHYVTSDVSDFKITKTTDLKSIPKSRTFRAPVSMYEPDFTTTTINADLNNCIFFPEGYIIRMKKGSLIDARGNEVNGDVQVHLRDLTPIDALVFSGVPMSYDTAGTSQILQTAGMFELYVEQNGEPLFLAPEQTVDITLPSPDGSPDYNLYYFDEEANTWDFSEPLPPANMSAQNREEVIIYSEAYLLMRLYFRDIYDTTSYSHRWLSSDYARLQPFDKEMFHQKKQRHSLYVSENVRYFIIRRYSQSSMPKKILFRLPEKPKPGQNMYAYHFRHLLPVRNVLWEYTGELNKRQFFQTYIKGKKYIDARIEYDNLSQSFIIELKTVEGVVEISARPVNFHNLEEEKLERHYERTAKRVNRTEKGAEKSFHRAQRSNQKRLDKNRERIRAAMSKEELEMTWEQWVEYALSVYDYLDSQQGGGATRMAQRRLSVAGFGMINVDRIMTIPQQRDLLVKFLLPNGEPLVSGTIMVVYGRQNSFIQHPVHSSGNNIKVSRSIPQFLCVVDHNEDVYYVYNSDISKALVKGKQETFSLRHLSLPPSVAFDYAMQN